MWAAAALVAGSLFGDDMGRGGGAANRVAFLAGYLSLTDNQRTQATTIFTAADTALATLRGQETTARDALTAAVKANRGDAELDRLAAALGVIRGQQAGTSAKAEARFYALLTAEQKTRYDALGNRGGGGGPGGRR
jgi:Spy/CpxP family protein refolding chaperone